MNLDSQLYSQSYSKSYPSESRFRSRISTANTLKSISYVRPRLLLEKETRCSSLDLGAQESRRWSTKSSLLCQNLKRKISTSFGSMASFKLTTSLHSAK